MSFVFGLKLKMPRLNIYIQLFVLHVEETSDYFHFYTFKLYRH